MPIPSTCSGSKTIESGVLNQNSYENVPIVCAGTLLRIIAWFAARGKFNTRLGRSAAAVSVALSPGHKIRSFDVMLTDWAFVLIEATKMNKNKNNFFIIGKDTQI